jgi:hypothetical protein
MEPRWDADRHRLPHARPLPSPFPEHEFVTQSDCYDTPSSPLSSTLMHFHDRLAYLCEAFHILSTFPPTWASVLYPKLRKRLVHGAVLSFKILPHWQFPYIGGLSAQWLP